MKQGFLNSELAAQARAFRCPRWAQLPSIDLYVDQVTGYVNDIFSPLNLQAEEKMLTKAMVNNYVKLRVMSAPQNKKYSRQHMAYLIAICALKQVFSIPEIAQLIQSQISHCPVEQAYDLFCDELEAALAQAFGGEDAPHPLPENEAALMLWRTAQCCAHKEYIQKRLAFEALPETE